MLPPTLQLASATQQTAPTRSGESAALGAFAKALSASSKKSAESSPNSLPWETHPSIKALVTPAISGLAGSHERATPDAIQVHSAGTDMQAPPASLAAPADANLPAVIISSQAAPTPPDSTLRDLATPSTSNPVEAPASPQIQGGWTLSPRETVSAGDRWRTPNAAVTPGDNAPLLEGSIPGRVDAAPPTHEDKQRLSTDLNASESTTSNAKSTPTANANQIARDSSLAPAQPQTNEANPQPLHSSANGTQFASVSPASLLPAAILSPPDLVAPAPQSTAKTITTPSTPPRPADASITAEKNPAPVLPEKDFQTSNQATVAKPAQNSGRTAISASNATGSSSNGKPVGIAPRNSVQTTSVRPASNTPRSSSELNGRGPASAASEAATTNSTGQLPAFALGPPATLMQSDSAPTIAAMISVNEGTSSPPPSTGGATPPRGNPATAPEETPTAASSTSAGAEVVQAARIINQAGQSQLHLGLRTQAFGSVQLHTQIRDSGVELLVGSQKGELHSFLTPETLKSELSARDGSLRLHDMRFLSQEQNSNSGGGRSQSEPRAPVHENRNRDSDGSEGDRPETGEATLEASWIRGRVSIRA